MVHSLKFKNSICSKIKEIFGTKSTVKNGIILLYNCFLRNCFSWDCSQSKGIADQTSGLWHQECLVAPWCSSHTEHTCSWSYFHHCLCRGGGDILNYDFNFDTAMWSTTSVRWILFVKTYFTETAKLIC